MAISSHIAIKMIVFSLAILPLVISGLKYGEAPNRQNLVLLLAGIALTVYEKQTGLLTSSYLWIFLIFIIGSIALLIFHYLTSSIDAGAIKTMMALLIWIPDHNYFVMLVLACVPFVLYAKIAGNPRAPYAPALAFGALAQWLI